MIRSRLPSEFLAAGLGPEPKLLARCSAKHLHWNVDHLLDAAEVDLVGATLVRSTKRIEVEVGQLLLRDDATEVLARGLGANDVAGNTHLLRVTGGEEWFDALPERLVELLVA